MSSITLPRIVEAMTNGLKSLEWQIEHMNIDIAKIEAKRDKALREMLLQQDVLKSVTALDDELAKDNVTLTLRFP